jgi:ABC-type transport system involved in Fe-S cluster assembly fused permease/ATPase subunit
MRTTNVCCVVLRCCASYGRGGKTTVISLLLRYYDVKGGSISFDGMDIRELNLGSMHKHIGGGLHNLHAGGPIA